MSREFEDMAHHRGVPLASRELANLVAIRSFVTLASREASVPGVMQRQAAVILLDAAIDRVVFTAAEYLGESFSDRDGVEKALQALRAQGWRPSQGAETARRRLHRVRNGVQHAGIGVDADELAGWVTSTNSLVGDVVRFAFQVELQDVRWSAGVRNDEVRGLLDTAEAALAGGEFEAAMRALALTYEHVFATWTRFAVDSRSSLAARHPSYVSGLGLIGGDDSKSVALQEVTLLSAISPSPSEALWFLEAARFPQLLNGEEVHRALAFVFALAVAVESSPAAQRIDRRQREAARRRRVRPIEGVPARVIEYRINERDGSVDLTLVLADVPPEPAFGEWLRVVQDGLDAGAGRPGTYWLHSDGTIDVGQVPFEVSPTLDLVQDVLSGADVEMARRRDAAAQRERDEEHAEVEFRARLEAAMRSTDPSSVRFTAGREQVHPFALRVFLDVPTSLNPYDDSVRGVLEQVGASGWPVGGARIETSMHPEDVATAAPVIAAAFDELVAEQQRSAEERQERLEPVVAELSRRGYRRADEL